MRKTKHPTGIYSGFLVKAIRRRSVPMTLT
ncbi:hypothetical protein, partial [Escherichia coli]